MGDYDDVDGSGVDDGVNDFGDDHVVMMILAMVFMVYWRYWR